MESERYGAHFPHFRWVLIGPIVDRGASGQQSPGLCISCCAHLEAPYKPLLRLLEITMICGCSELLRDCGIAYNDKFGVLSQPCRLWESAMGRRWSLLYLRPNLIIEWD